VTIFEQTLRDVLINANVTDDRVFLVRAPQVPAAKAANPYMIFFAISPTPHYDHSGPLDTKDRDYQVSIFDPSQSKALALADTLRDYLEHFRGDFSNVRFGAFFHRNQTHQYETDTKLYQIVQEWRILFAMTGGAFTQTRSTNRFTRSKV